MPSAGRERHRAADAHLRTELQQTRLHVPVDGRRLPDVAVPRDDLYQLARLAGPGSHLLRLDVPPKTTLYSFTFG